MNELPPTTSAPARDGGVNDPRAQAADLLRARHIGLINGRGLWTLYLKEIHRFLKVWMQALAAPMITTLLFLAIFTLAFGDRVRTVGDLPFDQFLAPGLIMMAMVQGAFANNSSSLLISKVQNNIFDVLMPPLSSHELTFAFTMAGVTRGLFVGASTTIGMVIFVDMSVANIWVVFYFAFMASLFLSLLGLIGGIWADKFDHIAAITNFIITPLAFLSGTFYSIERLPGIWNDFAHLNPFFLHDRRFSVRLHRPFRRAGLAGNGRALRAKCDPLVVFSPAFLQRLQAEDVRLAAATRVDFTALHPDTARLSAPHNLK